MSLVSEHYISCQVLLCLCWHLLNFEPRDIDSCCVTAQICLHQGWIYSWITTPHKLLLPNRTSSWIVFTGLLLFQFCLCSKVLSFLRATTKERVIFAPSVLCFNIPKTPQRRHSLSLRALADVYAQAAPRPSFASWDMQVISFKLIASQDQCSWVLLIIDWAKYP